MTTPGEDRPMMDHTYDGIQEYDNPMPRWWVLLFVVTIVFVPVYYLVPGELGNGAKRIPMYEKEMAAFRAAHPEALGAPPMTAAEADALVANAARIAEGRALFTANCVVCHRADGGGLIGPNLTDEFWIHGGTPLEVRNTIWNGVLAKGMPPWGRLLKPEQVNSLTAYVKSLRGTNPPNPKAPDGTPMAPAKP